MAKNKLWRIHDGIHTHPDFSAPTMEGALEKYRKHLTKVEKGWKKSERAEPESCTCISDGWR
jgi:hypothetical protein